MAIRYRLGARLRAFHITLLKAYERQLRFGGPALPSEAPRGFSWSGADSTICYLKAELRHGAQLKRLRRHIAYLKRQHYIKLQDEQGRFLLRLTAKGQFALLWARLLQQTGEQRKQHWDGIWRIIIFDVPEVQRSYRWTLRNLLRACGCMMLQFSVWVTPYNLDPALTELLRHLELDSYCLLLEIADDQCPPRFKDQFKRQRHKLRFIQIKRGN